MIINRIQELSQEIHSQLISIRRHLHAHPELSFQESATSTYISNILKQWNIPHQTNIGGYGVVAIVGDPSNGPTVALRADMDALPIHEKNDVDYRSQHDGIMHACGHDVHTTSLLGAIIILNEFKDRFPGCIKCIFQPAEEKLPGGASIMIREGVLKQPHVASIFAQHVHPPLHVGKVGFKPGIFMASADEIYITIEGKGGHAALPYEVVDPIAIAANLITQIQQVISRKANPAIPSVLSFGRIYSHGGATNVIPNKVSIEGTFRTMNEEWRHQAHDIIEQAIDHTTKAQGASYHLDLRKGYPFLHNDQALTLRMKKNAIEFLGEQNVVELPIRMTAEDFSYYSQEVPACFYRLGTGNPSKGIVHPIHTDRFDVDEDCLPIGAGLMAWNAMSELHHFNSL